MKKWSRRKFLEAGAASSIAIAGLARSGSPSMEHENKAAARMEAPERGLLRLAMDEIVPTGDGMPAASQAGALDYLNRLARRDGQIARELHASLDALERLSQKYFHTSFRSLSHENRVKSLTKLESQAPASFDTLRDYIYEAYYTRPGVWKLIGYEFHPTNGAGPSMKPFDATVLAQVRKKPRYYREVS